MDDKHHACCEAYIKNLTENFDKEKIYHMAQIQNQMLGRFEKTNEMLSNFNNLASTRFVEAEKDFKKQILLLVNLKKDIELIFKKIRILKSKLSKENPMAFQACVNVYEVPDDGDYNF